MGGDERDRREERDRRNGRDRREERDREKRETRDERIWGRRGDLVCATSMDPLPL